MHTMDTENTNVETSTDNLPPTDQAPTDQFPNDQPPADPPPTGETPTDPPTPRKLTRAEASRINGAKSRGPVTPEGKARSSQNALKHGLASRAVVLFNECQEEYDALLLEYRTLFKPMDQYEADLVTDIVNARWRIRRIQRFETAAIDLQLDETAPVMYEKYASVDIVTVETASFQDLAKNSRVLDVIHDYESRYYRIMERAQRDLQRYRQGRPERVSRQGLEPEKPAQGSPDGEAPPPDRSRKGFLPASTSGTAFSRLFSSLYLVDFMLRSAETPPCRGTRLPAYRFPYPANRAGTSGTTRLQSA
jgi:hypothetical protein